MYVVSVPPPEHPVQQAELDELVEESGERFTRRRLVTIAGAGALGALGTALFEQSGGTVLVEDPETAEFPGMPQAAIAEGPVSAVLPLDAN